MLAPRGLFCRETKFKKTTDFGHIGGIWVWQKNPWARELFHLPILDILAQKEMFFWGKKSSKAPQQFFWHIGVLAFMSKNTLLGFCGNFCINLLGYIGQRGDVFEGKKNSKHNKWFLDKLGVFIGCFGKTPFGFPGIFSIWILAPRGRFFKSKNLKNQNSFGILSVLGFVKKSLWVPGELWI